MPTLQIVVDRREDFRWADPGDRVITAEAYLASPNPAQGLSATRTFRCVVHSRGNRQAKCRMMWPW
ncbi:MAG TPA: hypothetical protein VGN07_19905, partial [Steroidobacteraceae bacterium]